MYNAEPNGHTHAGMCSAHSLCRPAEQPTPGRAYMSNKHWQSILSVMSKLRELKLHVKTQIGYSQNISLVYFSEIVIVSK